MWNNQTILIREGQFLTGRKELSKETGISETTVERILKMLENEQQIMQEKTTKFRIITIINWKEYQGGQQTDNKRTTDGQQTDTNKNDKNDKNDKNLGGGDKLEYFESLFNIRIPPEHLNAWRTWIEWKAENDKPIKRIGAQSDIQILKDAMRERISPTDLIKQTIDNKHSGMRITLNKLIEKKNGKIKVYSEPSEATQQELQEYATKNKLSPEQTTKLFKRYEYNEGKYRLKDTVCA